MHCLHIDYLRILLLLTICNLDVCKGLRENRQAVQLAQMVQQLVPGVIMRVMAMVAKLDRVVFPRFVIIFRCPPPIHFLQNIQTVHQCHVY